MGGLGHPRLELGALRDIVDRVGDLIGRDPGLLRRRRHLVRRCGHRFGRRRHGAHQLALLLDGLVIRAIAGHDRVAEELM